MRDHDPSTLWQVSAFERHRQDGGQQSAFAGLAPATRLSTTLMTELLQMEQRSLGGDVLSVMGVCMRQRESALLLLKHQDLVWPVTLFPREMLYLADELFFTGTAAEVSPIRSVDRYTVGAGRRGPITAELQQAYFDVVRDGANPRGWLTLVRDAVPAGDAGPSAEVAVG